jgi:hypothetical protein
VGGQYSGLERRIAVLLPTDASGIGACGADAEALRPARYLCWYASVSTHRNSRFAAGETGARNAKTAARQARGGRSYRGFMRARSVKNRSVIQHNLASRLTRLDLKV